MMDEHRVRELLLIIGGIISTLCSGSVVATGFIFNKTMLSRTHPFSNIIFVISLCDMLASIAMSFGFPSESEPHCHTQSFMLFFFFPASWLWTTALVYQLRCMMFYKRLKLSMFTLHCVCWGLALTVALVPLSQNDYGEDDDLSGRTVCFLKSTHKQRKFWWIFGMFYGVLISCVLLMSWWMISAYLQIKRMRGVAFTDYKERAIFKATRWYPLGLIITWSLSISVTFMLAIYPDVKIDYIQAGQIAQTQYGTLLALIFFSNSKIVRHRWRELLCPSKNPSVSHDGRITSSDESLDPEGDKFSTTDSMAEGPRMSDVAHLLSFGFKTGQSFSQRQRNNSDGHTNSGDSSSAPHSDTTNMRTSTLIREWLVSSARNKELELSDTSENSSVAGDNNGGKKSPQAVQSPLQPPAPGSPLQLALKMARTERKDAQSRNNSKADSEEGIVEV